MSVECASNVGPGHDLFVRPMACSCKGKVCKGKCSLCLNEGHLPLTLKYAAAFQMVSVLRPSCCLCRLIGLCPVFLFILFSGHCFLIIALELVDTCLPFSFIFFLRLSGDKAEWHQVPGSR